MACRSTQLGEGHRQNSAVARNERFSLASGRQVRQDRCCSRSRSVFRATAPLRGGFGVSGVPLFWQSPSKKFTPIPCRKNCRHSSVSGLIKLAEALTDLREGYQRTRSVNPARHAHPSRRLWRFFGMGCAWLRAAGGGCLRQGFDFRCARWSAFGQIGSEERSSSNLTKELGEGRKGSVPYCVYLGGVQP